MTLGIDWVLSWIKEAARVIENNREALIKLDRDIGDGDHGENMDRGFAAVVRKIDDDTPTTVAEALKLVATTLMSTVGGAAGPLYGTAFLRASKAAGQAEDQRGSLDAQAIADLLAAGLEGIVARGKAETGEKTMVDAWAPAVAAAKNIAATGGQAQDALRAAAQGARTGARATEPLVAKKGRASYLGERAVGYRDPGAQSTALILQAAAGVVEE